VRTPARILIVDDNPTNIKMLRTRLAAEGYEIVTAADGEQALVAAREQRPDLILLDIMMPKLDGIEVCKRLRADAAFPFTPIVLVTAMADTKDVIAGLDAGGDEYLTKPIDHGALVARVRSMLRIKALHDRAEGLADEVKEWNASLERRVAEQVAELERVGRLRRFFSPQLAEAILEGGAADPLRSHRRDITVVFCDLHGFTAFAEISEPEEVMGVLREYHAACGELILRHEGTLERFTGDGMMIFFNDPVPMPDAPERALRMALAMRDRIGAMSRGWVARGHELSHRIGIAQGYATLGAIGFEGRWDYGAIGTVTNLAARLCAEAASDQVLVSQRIATALADLFDFEPPQALTLKGFHRTVPACTVRGPKG
jgi:class 3 adenylate cyclase/CheY-like chemotaxis protein